MNQSGSELWPALAEDATRQELIERLGEVYEITDEQTDADVDAFLATCQDRGFFEESHTPARIQQVASSITASWAAASS